VSELPVRGSRIDLKPRNPENTFSVALAAEVDCVKPPCVQVAPATIVFV